MVPFKKKHPQSKNTVWLLLGFHQPTETQQNENANGGVIWGWE